MAVVGLTEIKGNVQNLLAKYDKVNEELMAREGPPPGLLVHTCVVLPDGIRIANVWETKEQALAAFRDESFQSALRNAGFQPIEPAIFPTHNHTNFAAMASVPR